MVWRTPCEQSTSESNTLDILFQGKTHISTAFGISIPELSSSLCNYCYDPNEAPIDSASHSVHNGRTIDGYVFHEKMVEMCYILSRQ